MDVCLYQGSGGWGYCVLETIFVPRSGCPHVIIPGLHPETSYTISATAVRKDDNDEYEVLTTEDPVFVETCEL